MTTFLIGTKLHMKNKAWIIYKLPPKWKHGQSLKPHKSSSKNGPPKPYLFKSLLTSLQTNPSLGKRVLLNRRWGRKGRWEEEGVIFSLSGLHHISKWTREWCNLLWGMAPPLMDGGVNSSSMRHLSNPLKTKFMRNCAMWKSAPKRGRIAPSLLGFSPIALDDDT